jgi:hypothetical protein
MKHVRRPLLTNPNFFRDPVAQKQYELEKKLAELEAHNTRPEASMRNQADSPQRETPSARSSTRISPSRYRADSRWTKVDRVVEEMGNQLARASTEEQFQGVGLLGREALISLAQAIYDPALYPTTDGVSASEADAKRMLEAFLREELPGSSNEARRKHARASVDLAVALQHQRTATLRDAQLCVEAVMSVIRTVAIIGDSPESVEKFRDRGIGSLDIRYWDELPYREFRWMRIGIKNNTTKLAENVKVDLMEIERGAIPIRWDERPTLPWQLGRHTGGTANWRINQDVEEFSDVLHLKEEEPGNSMWVVPTANYGDQVLPLAIGEKWLFSLLISAANVRAQLVALELDFRGTDQLILELRNP